jgi:hypothetical protein
LEYLGGNWLIAVVGLVVVVVAVVGVGVLREAGVRSRAGVGVVVLLACVSFLTQI